MWNTATGFSSWSYKWDAKKVSNGEHHIYARIIRNSEVSSIAHVIVIVDTIDSHNLLPTITIEYPKEGSTVSGEIVISGRATDDTNTILLIEVRIYTNKWMQFKGGVQWSTVWNSTHVAGGSHILYARSYDGNQYS